MRRLLILLLGVGLLGACESPSITVPAPDLSDAEGRVASRISTLRDVVLAHSDSAPAWGRLALNLQAHGYSDEAAAAYAKARHLNPEIFDYWYLPAMMLAGDGDPAAEDLFARARSIRPDYPPLLLREAEWLVTRGRYADVAELLSDTSASGASSPHRSFLRGRAALALGDTADAQQHLEASITAMSRFGRAHALLAELYRNIGRADLADVSRERARLFEDVSPPLDDPVFARVVNAGVSARWHLVRGRSYLEGGQPDDAVRELREAVAVSPDDAYAVNLLGTALETSGRLDEALETYRDAVDIRPGYGPAEVNYARALFRSGMGDEATRRLEALVAEDSAYADAYLLLGMFAQGRGRPARAAEYYLASLRRTAFDPRAAIRLAWILGTSRRSGLRNGQQAVALAERVAVIESNSEPATLDVLAAAYAEYGDFERAVAAAARGVALARRDGQHALASAIEGRMQGYRENLPYRE